MVPLDSAASLNVASGRLAFRLIWDFGGIKMASVVILFGDSNSSILKTMRNSFGIKVIVTLFYAFFLVAQKYI